MQGGSGRLPKCPPTQSRRSSRALKSTQRERVQRGLGHAQAGKLLLLWGHREVKKLVSEHTARKQPLGASLPLLLPAVCGKLVRVPGEALPVPLAPVLPLCFSSSSLHEAAVPCQGSLPEGEHLSLEHPRPQCHTRKLPRPTENTEWRSARDPPSRSASSPILAGGRIPSLSASASSSGWA